MDLSKKKIFSLSQITTSLENFYAKEPLNKFYFVRFFATEWKYLNKRYYAVAYQKNENNVVICKIKILIFAYDIDRILRNNNLKKEDFFKDNVELIAECKYQYSSIYGLSLHVFDAQLANMPVINLEKQQTLDKLKQENIIDLNKGLKPQKLVKNIAVITSYSSNALIDFKQKLDDNFYHFCFCVDVFNANTTSDKSVESILSSFDEMYKNDVVYDYVVIIRAGGGELSAYCFDNYLLAKQVACCKFPVLISIGHADTKSAMEEVAFKSFISSTDVADYIINHNQKSILDFEQLVEKIKLRSKFLIERKLYKINNLKSNIYYRASNLINKKNQRIINIHQRNIINFQKLISTYELKIEQLENLIKNQKDFLFFTVSGQKLADLESLNVGDEVFIFHNGKSRKFRLVE